MWQHRNHSTDALAVASAQNPASSNFEIMSRFHGSYAFAISLVSYLKENEESDLSGRFFKAFKEFRGAKDKWKKYASDADWHQAINKKVEEQMQKEEENKAQIKKFNIKDMSREDGSLLLDIDKLLRSLIAQAQKVLLAKEIISAVFITENKEKSINYEILLNNSWISEFVRVFEFFYATDNLYALPSTTLDSVALGNVMLLTRRLKDQAGAASSYTMATKIEFLKEILFTPSLQPGHVATLERDFAALFRAMRSDDEVSTKNQLANIQKTMSTMNKEIFDGYDSSDEIEIFESSSSEKSTNFHMNSIMGNFIDSHYEKGAKATQAELEQIAVLLGVSVAFVDGRNLSDQQIAAAKSAARANADAIRKELWSEEKAKSEEDEYEDEEAKNEIPEDEMLTVIAIAEAEAREDENDDTVTFLFAGMPLALPDNRVETKWYPLLPTKSLDNSFLNLSVEYKDDGNFLADYPASILSSSYSANSDLRETAPFATFAQNANGYVGYPVNNNQSINGYICLRKSLGWLAFGVVQSVALYYSGALNQIPYIAPVVEELGDKTIAAAMPIIAITEATLWYGVIKPLGSCFAKWCCKSKQAQGYSNVQLTQADSDEYAPVIMNISPVDENGGGTLVLEPPAVVTSGAKPSVIGNWGSRKTGGQIYQPVSSEEKDHDKRLENGLVASQ